MYEDPRVIMGKRVSHIDFLCTSHFCSYFTQYSVNEDCRNNV